MERVDDLIYDVGLNVGQDAEFYLKKGFRVVGIEANPVVADVARSRLSPTFGERLEIVTVGIGPSHEVLPFYVNRRHHEQSTFLKQFTNGATWDMGLDVIEVRVTSIDDVIRKHGVPHYMKIDIEAWDMIVLNQLGECGARPKYISVETGPTLDWIRKLQALGYSSFKLRNQSKNRDIVLTPPAAEGRFCEHRFEWGCAGPFGEETPGEWESADSVASAWKNHIDNGFPEGNWFDVHARFPE